VGTDRIEEMAGGPVGAQEARRRLQGGAQLAERRRRGGVELAQLGDALLERALRGWLARLSSRHGSA
jgi:hypothetical protein